MAVEGILLFIEAVQKSNIHGAHIDTAVRPREQVGHAAVIGVEVGCQNIPARRVGFQFPEALFKRLPADRSAEARIDQQIGILSTDKIAVQFFQRISREDDPDPVNILIYFFYHFLPLLFCLFFNSGKNISLTSHKVYLTRKTEHVEVKKM